MPGSVGAYRLVRHWASGDTSQIFLARRGDAATLVALKTLRAELTHDRAHRQRFANEAALAERVEHEHLVETFESFEHQGERYLAMEFLHGETLHDILRAIHPHRRMPAALALELVHRLARALQHLHALGAIHGDVCPANVVVTYDGRVKLLDLGGRCEGTNSYASPEQARGEAIDARADVFSLGLILLELLTGHRARQGWSEREIVASVISGSIPRLSDLVEVDPELDALVSMAVAHDPRVRYVDAACFADALLAYRERAVPGLILESKLADFMEHNFAGRARSLSATLAGERRSRERELDPVPQIEAALRNQASRSMHPFVEPITSDVSWTGERTSPSELGPIPRRRIWPITIGLTLILMAALVAGFLLGRPG